jgi:hypothetical protein
MNFFYDQIGAGKRTQDSAIDCGFTNRLKASPRMLVGAPVPVRLDSRLKDAGMTVFGRGVSAAIKARNEVGYEI